MTSPHPPADISPQGGHQAGDASVPFDDGTQMKQFRNNARAASKIGAGKVTKSPNGGTFAVGRPMPQIIGAEAIRRLNPGISDEGVLRVLERHRRPYNRERGHR
jgi:hypothetical protein